MKNITPIVAAILIVLSVGIVAGYKMAISKHDKLVIKIQADNLKQLTAVQDKANEYKATSEKYYQDYLDASSIKSEPERVFIKASCPALPTNTGGNVGNAGNAGRIELHRTTVESVTAVTDQAQRDVLKCKAQVTSLQEKIKLFNKGK